MMRMLPEELILLRLRGKRVRRGLQAKRALAELYALSVEECLSQLRTITGEDFGDDLDRWETHVAARVVAWEREGNSGDGAEDGA
jgi:hypothetical protein